MPINEMAFGVPTKSATDPLGYGAPVGGLLLDRFPNAAAAYSLRRLRSAYNGAAIRVRRTDNAELNIGFLYDGSFDVATLLNFVGRGDGFVTTWYDQSGNGRNATQSTSANQPRIINNGLIDALNGKSSIYFDGSNDRLVFSSVAASVTYTAISVIMSTNEGSQADAIIGGGSGSTTFRLLGNNPPFIQITHANVLDYASGEISPNIQTLATFITNATSSRVFSQGVIRNTAGTFTPTQPIIYIGFGGSSQYFKNNMQEIILFSSDQSANRPLIESSINQYYSIY